MVQHARTRREGGFTLIEIMIVILIMSIILAIAVPNWIKARETSRTRACMTNLKQIESAKEQYAMTSGTSNGDPVDWLNIVPDYIKRQPECPNSGAYTPEPIGTAANCTIPEHILP